LKKLKNVLAAIDEANAYDPDTREGEPAAQLYGQRMSVELNLLFPDRSEPLQIAARGQHIERWTLKRKDFAESRTGYLTRQSELAQHHASRVGEIMEEAGYDRQDIERASKMIRKEGVKRDADIQALENVICFTFLRWYLAPFASTQGFEKLDGIVAKTARTMSPEGRALALREFDLPAHFADKFRI
jgi:hypothetical protein